MGPATKASAERQAVAIREAATEPRHHELAERAAAGEFTDYADTHACPITELHRLCREQGLNSIADRLAAGEFDANKEESDEWANSPSGQAAIARMLNEMQRAMLSDSPPNDILGEQGEPRGPQPPTGGEDSAPNGAPSGA